jgi:hypothetical protein
MHSAATFLTLVAIAGWFALSGLVNAIFHKWTPADVDTWAESNPRLAWVAAFFRRAGFEPVAVFTLIRDFFSTNPPPPSFLSGNAAMGKRRVFVGYAPGYEPGTPPPASRGAVEVSVAALLGGIALGLLAFVVACGLLGAPAVPAAITLAECEARVALTHPGAPFTEIVKASIDACAKDASVLLVDVLQGFLDSKDPALAPYKPEAKAALEDARKMNVLRAEVHHR